MQPIENSMKQSIRVGVHMNWNSYTNNYGLLASNSLNIYVKRSFEYFITYLNITSEFFPVVRSKLISEIRQKNL